MQNSSFSESRRGLLITLLLLGMVTALVLVPSQFPSEAGAKKGEGLFPRTTSHEEGLDFYDVRMDETKEGGEILARFRQASGKDASFIADQRDQYVRAEESLRSKVPTLQVDYNLDLRIPEIIGPDVNRGRVFLTAPSSAKRSEILRNFVIQNNDLVGMTDRQVQDLKVQSDYTNPDGNLSYSILEQTINGIPVSRGEVKAGFTKAGEIIRVINNLAPGLDYASLSTDFNDPVNAVRSAARHVNHEVRPWETTINTAKSNDLKVTFGTELYATTAEKLYFPTEPGVAVPAWRVTIWKDVAAYEVTVDAATGTMLRRENMVKDQTQSVTYNVWANTTSALRAMDNPAPLTPGPIDPSLGTQGTNVARTSVTLIGNEAPYTFNNNGWINDGANTTSGNNVNAGLDRGNPNGVDAATTGSGMRVFDFAANPPPGNPAPGDDPIPAGTAITPCPAAPPATINASQHAAVTQMFYVANRLHDETYRRGFVEQARNFQVDNFGRGGTGGDPVQAEGQDCSGSNNANMASTSTDGSLARMQMYLWTPPTPADRDGTVDAEIIVHEIGHGIMNRLHTLGTAGTQGGQMHEGTGDFLAHLLLSEATDPINGIYTTGGYSTMNLRPAAPFLNLGNYYYGIRRFPKAVIAFTGGPMNRPHNPLTYKDIDPLQFGVADGAFAPAFVGSATAVHDGGELWSSFLWEVRALLVARLGHAAGTAKMLQLQLDGMKLNGANPTMLSERNAIIAGALAGPDPGPDTADVREGFRRRGMGFSAANPSANNVVEAFDFPNISVVDPFSVSDSTGDNDGYPEPGENVLLSVAVTNTTGGTINNVVANANGGANVSYGTINNGQTVVRNIPYTVPAGAVCGSMHQVSITASSDVGTQAPVIREFRLGAPVGGAPVTFASTTAVTIGDNAPATPYSTAINVSGLTGNKVIKLELTGVSHTFPGDIDFQLVGPAGQKFMGVSDSGGGGDVTNMTISFTDTAAGLPSTTQWVAGTFRPHNVDTTSDAFPAPAPAAPYLNPAPAGTDTFAGAFGSAGSALNGTWTLWIRDDAAADFGTMTGWKLTFEANDFACNIAVESRADFDGDGRTDMSVFRGSEGNWYLNRSTSGFAAIGFGNSTDTLVPGDFDGDGKADTAVFRPSASATTPDFYILNSNGFTVSGIAWGTTGDTPVVADYDADGRTDVGVYRSSNNTWYVLNSNGGSNYTAVFGVAGDVPMAMDTNGDGRAQIAMYRPSNNTWYIARPTGTPATNFDAIPFGTAGDKLVPADYDGDNRDDVAVYRPSNGTWYIIRSTGGISILPFGNSTDVPVPGDYDGDGSDDIAVYRGGTWYVQRSTAGLLVQPFGLATDTAVPAKYIP
jgi:subtilisin-like proprotein convertase family protein